MTTAVPSEARKILRRLQRDIVALDRLMECDSGVAFGFDDLARIYNALDRAGDHCPGLTQQLAAVRERYRESAARLYPRGEDRVVVDGAGVLELCSVGAKDVWDGPLLVKTLAARCADEATDRATGEIMPPAVLAEKVAGVIIDVAGLDTKSQTFRKGKVTSYGLLPGNYVEREAGRLSVRFTD